MDKEGAYTRQGLEEQLAANSEARARVKEAIRTAAAQAQTEQGFIAALAEQGVKAKKTRRSGWTYTVDGGSVVREWALGSAWSAEAVRQRMAGGSVRSEPDNWLDRLEAEFMRTASGTAEEVAVRAARSMVDKITKDGILLRLPDERLAFIDRSHVVYEKETDSFRVYLSGGYRYSVSGPEGKTEQVRGEDLLRALELAGGVQPEWVELAPADIGAVSPKGLSLSIPELGMDSLFLEDRFLEYAPDGSGVRAAVYGNWSYQFRTADGSMRYLNGRELLGRLRGRQEAVFGQPLLARVNAMSRRRQGLEARKLAQALLLARQEGIGDLEGFAPRLARLREQEAELRSGVRALKVRNEAYRAAAKYLVTYNEYLPVQLQAMELSGKARRSYELTHEAELAAWRHAKQFLEGSGVEPEVDPEKVKGLIREQELEAGELESRANALAARAAALEEARDELSRTQDRKQPAPRYGPEL